MNPLHPSSRGQVQPLVAVALGVVAVVGFAIAVAIAGPGASAGAGASNRPSTPPSSAPSTPPSTAPSAKPTSVPAATPTTGRISVDLKNASDHDVTLLIHGEIGTVVKAESGTPGDGMSVRWHDAFVRNVDPRTVRVTWVGLPGDETVDLDIVERNNAYRLTLVQAGPYRYTDAMGEDRVVLLTFDRPVSAADVSIEILDRTVD
jgi:hypothetical protein